MVDTANIGNIIELQKLKTDRWHHEEIIINEQDLLEFVEKNHMFNYLLWHEEDKARRDDMGFEYVYDAKRLIDGYNQNRNNMMQAMDEWVFHNYQPKQQDVPFHSETPGMIIDRLSILSLKEYHMAKQVNRQDVDQKHIDNCQGKLSTIELQLQQLAACLQEFIQQIVNGERSFRVYHQFKMYNDAELNPQLYQNK